MYDFFLGGHLNWAVDRMAAERAIELLPWVRDVARANRAFLRRAVLHCLDAGIDQFVDIGSGIPTVGNVHEIADVANPDSRVVYIDNEAVALAHGRLHLEETGDPRRHAMVRADLRDAKPLWRAVRRTGVLDMSRPIALLTVAVLHFVPDSDEPQSAMAYYRSQLPAGSALVLSHGTLDGVTAGQQAVLDKYTAHYATTQNPLVWRTKAELAEFLGEMEIAEPGIVYLPDWRPDPSIAPELAATFTESRQSLGYCAVAHVRRG